MTSENPYAAPKSSVVKDDDGSEYGALKIYTDKGRLGRLRYMVYSFGLFLVVIIVATALYFIPKAGPILSGISVIIAFLISLNLTIQRCHDFNSSSFLALAVMIFVPIASVIFFVIPGTKEKNKYGLQPPPNTTPIKIGSVILGILLLAVIGMIASWYV